MYVTTDRELPDLIQKLENCDVLAVDTEFVREKTYFHRLGLIQIAGGDVCAAVDPISVKDLDPLLDLCNANENGCLAHVLWCLGRSGTRTAHDTEKLCKRQTSASVAAVPEPV